MNEKILERPAKHSEEAPPAEAELPPSEVEVVVPALRCPYCHDACAPDNSVVCRDCLARHHSDCWPENGACSACQSTVKLVAEQRPVLSREEALERIRRGKSDEVERSLIAAGLSPEEALRKTAKLACEELQALGPVRAPILARIIFGLQTAILGVLSIAVLFTGAEVPVLTALFSMLIASVLMIAIKLAGNLRHGFPLLTQFGLTIFGTLSGAALIESLNIPPHRSSLSLAFLGLILTALFAFGTVRGFKKRTREDVLSEE